MKRNHFFLLAMMLFGSLAVSAQSDFTSCAAAFLDSKRMVNEYSTKGFCEVSQSAKGILSVCQISLNEDGDKIVLMTRDRLWALPHSEITVK
ncbi:MAG: hypothetical protein R3C61_16980 [Bacteroidia bacterium]